MTETTLNNPWFARCWATMTRHEPASLQRLRGENLAGLRGRVLEVGAGTGTNFAHYPAGVTEVVAVEPEPRLAHTASGAARTAPVPVTVTSSTIETLPPGAPFDAVVCSLVLCSVDEPDAVLRTLFDRLRPGGELRYLEHVASDGIAGRVQRWADATVWPRLLGNCHTHRHTENAIAAAGFTLDVGRHEWSLPRWAPVPVSELAIGRAVRPA